MNRTFEVDSATLAASIDGQGPAFIWAHALTSSRRREERRSVFDVSAIADDFTVVRYDARGHGESNGLPVQEHYDWSRMADDLVSIIDQLDARPALAGGASMGAATSLWAALTHPQHLRGIVLATPPAAWEAKPERADGWRRGAHIAEKYGADELTRRTAGAPPPAIYAGETDVRDTASDIPEALLPSVLRGAADSDLPDAAALARIDTPALILAWRGDPDHPVETAERLHESLPHSQLHIADDLAATRSWTDLVRAFLRSSAQD